MSPTTRCNQPLCRNQAICIPVMVVPIKGWPVPLYLQYKGGLCNNCAAAFNINKFTDWDGSWYDMACDTLRSYRKPAINPFPGLADFKWEDHILNPEFDPEPKDKCYIQFWKLETLKATGMHWKPKTT
jgi:hypothetical protein